MVGKLKRSDLILPDLSYKIVGILFDVFNSLGYGYKEIYYQRAIVESFRGVGISFKEQITVPLIFKGKKIGDHRFDFLVEDKIILEIKRGDYFSRSDINQLHGYLLSSGLKLGLLAYFSSKGLKFKRIVNIKKLRSTNDY